VLDADPGIQMAPPRGQQHAVGLQACVVAFQRTCNSWRDNPLP
jgi:hypothetical protein